MPLTKTVMPLTNFSPYLKNGVLDLNKEGNKFSSGKGGKKFTDTFDVRKLVEFIKTTPGITELNAANCGIGKMPIDEFRLLMKAIKKSEITELNLGSNTLTPEMADEISKLNKLSKLIKCIECTKITVLDISSCQIDDDAITKIVKGLRDLVALNVENNGITDTGVGAIVKKLPKLLALNVENNRITGIGADKIADGLNEIQELLLPYGNDISYSELKKVVVAHSNTLIVFNAFSSAYSVEQIREISTLLPNCTLKLGPYWTRGVNKDDDAPFPLDGKVHLYIIKLAEDPAEDSLPLVGAVEGDNAPPLIVPVGENNNALPPVDLVGVVGDILEG